MSKQKISATIITYNEEANIERCLKSLYWVDEIVVVDSFSSDKTVAICEKYNCKVIRKEWEGFGKTKKFAVESASNDWIFSIDADEEVTEELAEEIVRIVSNPFFNIYKIKRNSFFLGKAIKHCGWDKDYPKRLFNRNYGNFNEALVHESIIIEGERGTIEKPLNHYSYPTLQSHTDKINLYSGLGAEEYYKIGRSSNPVSAIANGTAKFIKMYFLNLGFLDGVYGFILSVNSAYGVYLKYIKLWALHKGRYEK